MTAAPDRERAEQLPHEEIAVPAPAAVSGTTGRRLLGVLALLGALAALAAGWLLVRGGIRVDEFPPYLPDSSATPITRYSGPWITAAAGAVLIAGLLVLLGAAELLRGRRSTWHR